MWLILFEEMNISKLKVRIRIIFRFLVGFVMANIGAVFSGIEKNRLKPFLDVTRKDGRVYGKRFMDISREYGSYMLANKYKISPLVSFPTDVDVRVLWEWSRFEHVGADSVEEFFKTEYIYLRGYSIIGFGPLYISGLETSMRLINLLYLYANKAERDYSIETFIYRLFLWTYYNVENQEKEFKGNHYLITKIALFIASSVLFGNSSNKYGKLQKELLKELPKQFNADGSYYENSTGYHGFALSALLILDKFTPLYNDVIRRYLDILLPKAMDFYKWCTVNDEFFLKVGDYDGAKFLSAPSLYENMYPLSYTQLSKSNLENSAYTFEKQIDESTISYKYFDDFGLFIVRGTNFYFALRTGTSGGKLTHAHYDYGSFSLYIDGFPIWTDKGNSSYNLNLNTRIQDRSSVSHNGLFNETEENLERFNDIELQCFSIRHEITNGTLQIFYKMKRNGIDYNRDVVISADHFAIIDSKNVKPLSEQKYFYIDYGKRQNITYS